MRYDISRKGGTRASRNSGIGVVCGSLGVCVLLVASAVRVRGAPTALPDFADGRDGPRYQYPNSQCSLPSLPTGKPFGTTRNTEAVVAIADAGCFLDPRSCQDFRQDYTCPCPHHKGSSGEWFQEGFLERDLTSGTTMSRGHWCSIRPSEKSHRS